LESWAAVLFAYKIYEYMCVHIYMYIYVYIIYVHTYYLYVIDETMRSPMDRMSMEEEQLDSWAAESFAYQSYDGHPDGVTCIHVAHDTLISGGRDRFVYNMCVQKCIHICTYIYIYTYMRICVFIYIYTYTYIDNIYMNTYMYISVYIFTCM